MSERVIYFHERAKADQVAKSIGGRVVYYPKGYAVQYWISGPYYPEHVCRPARAITKRAKPRGETK